MKSMNQMFSVTTADSLSPSGKQALLSLYEACALADKTDTPLYLSTDLNYYKKIPPFYFAWEKEKLAGFLVLFMPEKEEAEVTAYTHPAFRGRGCFRALCAAAKEICRENGIRRLLYTVDAACESGQTVLKSSELASYQFSEYKLELEEAQPYRENRDISFEPVTEGNAEVYRETAAEALESRETAEIFLESMLSGPTRKGYIEYWKGIPVGVCHINVQNGEAGIYGLGVLKKFRGTGLGKQFVRYMSREAAGSGLPVVIEVDSDNQRAYSIYRKYGFRVVQQTDYFVDDL